MTDASGRLPDDGASPSAERMRLLCLIAETLNLPLSAFACGSVPAPPEGPTAAECAEALAAFSRIGDPYLRGQCLRMLEHCAEP